MPDCKATRSSKLFRAEERWPGPERARERTRIRLGASRWHIGCVFNLTALLP